MRWSHLSLSVSRMRVVNHTTLLIFFNIIASHVNMVSIILLLIFRIFLSRGALIEIISALSKTLEHSSSKTLGIAVESSSIVIHDLCIPFSEFIRSWFYRLLLLWIKVDHISWVLSRSWLTTFVRFGSGRLCRTRWHGYYLLGHVECRMLGSCRCFDTSLVRRLALLLLTLTQKHCFKLSLPCRHSIISLFGLLRPCCSLLLLLANLVTLVLMWFHIRAVKILLHFYLIKKSEC